MSASTAAFLHDVELGPAMFFLPKGRREPLQCHAVRSIDDLVAPDTEETLCPVDLTARLWRLHNKSVEMTSLSARVVALGEHTVVLEGLSLDLRDKVKLDLELPGQVLTDLYATVSATRPLRLHLSGISADGHRAIHALLAQRSSMVGSSGSSSSGG